MVDVQDHGSDEFERAYEAEDEEEKELEGLDVDLDDIVQIPPLTGEMLPTEAERTLMLEEGDRPRYRESSREDEGETLLVSNLPISAITRDEA